MMAGVRYSDVVEVLLERFPEFRECEEFQWVDLDLAYSVWGTFGRYITEYMRRLPAAELDDDALVNRVFDLANELMDSDDDDTQTIVVVELLENLFMYRKTLELGRRKLRPKHVTWLNRQGAWLGTSDLHYEGELIAPNGLHSLGAALSRCSWEIELIQRTGDEAPRLESNDDRIDLEMDRGAGPGYSFFGGVGSSADEARGLLGELSDLLARVDIAHCIRLYRTGRADSLLEEFRHRWPDGGEAAGV